MKKLRSSLFCKYMILFMGVLLLTNAVFSAMVIIFLGPGRIPPFAMSAAIQNPISPVLVMGVVSMAVGTVFIFFATKIVLKPIKMLSEAAKKVAEGDFSTQLPTSSTEDEISVFMNNFNVMVYELSRNEYLHKDFVSNVSHEFKTPIAAISGYAELMSSPVLSDSKRLEHADVISRQTARLAKLSSDLLRLSELEKQNIAIKNECFSLDEQIRDSILLLQSEWEQKNIEMDIELEEVSYTGDKNLLHQAWVNIISNAVRYSNLNGKIQVIIRKSSDRIRVSIKDNGIGMTKEQTERIFECFYRADESRTGKGTGLGLSIAKRILTLHGGTIEVHSSMGKGTEFVVELIVL